MSSGRHCTIVTHHVHARRERELPLNPFSSSVTHGYSFFPPAAPAGKRVLLLPAPYLRE